MKNNFHNFLFGISILPALLVMPAIAADPNTTGNAWVFGDVTLDNQQVTTGAAAFGGRRMEWHGNKYQNDFPKYKLVGRSFEVSNSDVYVGPVTLTLRELTNNDAFSFNYTVEGTDTDLAESAGITWTDQTADAVFGKVVTQIGQSDAQYTAPAVYLFVQRDNNKAAGSLSFDNTTAMIDGSTINAKTISVTNGSVLNFVKQDKSKLTAFYDSNIASDGITTLNSDTVNIDGSEMNIKSGAKLVINSATSTGQTTIKNVTSAYGALTMNGNGSVLLDGNVLVFDNNKSTSHGAALYYKDQTDGENEARLVAKNITFKNNVSETGASSGGAVFSTGGSMFILGDNNTFTGNKILGTDVAAKLHKRGGGAIANQSYEVEGVHTPIDANMVIGKQDGSSTNLFSGNTSSMNGGAIMNRAVDEDGNAYLVINGSTVFRNNSANLNGGAIYNFAEIGKTAEVTINGDVIFAGNTDSTGANDIYNTGIINLNGNATLDGGITGTGALTVADGATLNIGTASIEQGTVTLNGTLIATLREGGAQLNVADTFDGTGSLKLVLNNAGTYHVFADKLFEKANGIDVSSSLFDIDWSTNQKDITATLKSVEDIAGQNGVSAETAGVLAGITSSSSEKLNDLSVKIQEKLANGTDEDKKAVNHAVAALNPEKASVVQSVTSSVQNTVSSLASKRMSLPSMGRNGGDVKLTSGGVWVQGLFNKSKLNDQFNSYTRGVAAGMDGTFNKHWMIGMGYAFNHSDVALNARDTDIDSNTVFLYGQYKPTDWYMNATVNYTLSDYEEYSEILGGVKVTADYRTSAFGANVATGYELEHNVTPEFALRYLHVNGETYTNNQDVQNKLNDADYLTAVLGTRYNPEIKAGKYLTLNPELHYAVKYDLISDKSSVVVTMPGVDAYAVNGERLSRVGGEFGAGFGIKYRELDISVNYDIDVRQDYTSQTGMLKFRYNF